MVRYIDAAKGHFASAITWLGQQRKWFPLATTAAILLLGLLPMATASWLGGVHVSVYQLSFDAVLRFVLAPLTIAAVWAFDRFMQDFARYTKLVLTIAAAVQMISLCMLLFSASTALNNEVAVYYANASAVPQNLGVGAVLMLAVSFCFLVDCGLQLTKGKAATKVPTNTAKATA